MPRTLRQFIGFFVVSFKSQLRTPSAWIFGFLFPLIFIVLFGFISNNQNPEIKVGLLRDDGQIYSVLKDSLSKIEIFSIQEYTSLSTLNTDLENGDIDGYVEIFGENRISLTSNSNRPENVSVIINSLDKINSELTFVQNQIPAKVLQIEQKQMNARETRYIDFVLPGILGYALISAAIFGVGFSFLAFRKENVLKRIFAAPTYTPAFLLGQSLSRFIFIFSQNVLQLAVAMAFFGFMPRNGFSGVLEILVVVVLGLIVFLGFGYVVAGVAKTDDTVAPIANLIVIPQFILAGTFFPVNSLPGWLEAISKAMPLYNFNQAIRFISIDGLGLFSVPVLIQLAFLILWGILAYSLATRVFKVK